MNDTKKWFTIQKVGYTKGVYGCSGEYFSLIVYNSEKDLNGERWLNQYFFEGMYGAEQRVAAVLKEVGYTDRYTQSIYGRLVRSDIPKNRFMSEYSMINELKLNLVNTTI